MYITSHHTEWRPRLARYTVAVHQPNSYENMDEDKLIYSSRYIWYQFKEEKHEALHYMHCKKMNSLLAGLLLFTYSKSGCKMSNLLFLSLFYS